MSAFHPFRTLGGSSWLRVKPDASPSRLTNECSTVSDGERPQDRRLPQVRRSSEPAHRGLSRTLDNRLMAFIGIYSSKGGVGKTTLAGANLAWASASISRRRTLLWDLDPQGGASYILKQQAAGGDLCDRIIGKQGLLSRVRRSGYDKMDVLASDPSLQHLERHFHDLGKRRRLAKAADELSPNYDRIIVDCPPGLTETSDQILRAMDLVLVPVIPAALSRRALDVINDHLQAKKGPRVRLMPVFGWLIAVGNFTCVNWKRIPTGRLFLWQAPTSA